MRTISYLSTISLVAAILVTGALGLVHAQDARNEDTDMVNSQQRFVFFSQTAQAPIDAPDTITYDFGSFTDHAKSVSWEMAGLFAGVTASGVINWKWGSSSFHGNPEGWFGKDTGSLGTDKLGHAYATYLMTELLADQIRSKPVDPQGSELSAFMISMGVMTYVELFDGFSEDHGFSYEDLVANIIGGGFSYLRRTVPGLREKVDFRLEYLPSGDTNGFHPIIDYSGQKYLLALKFAGFETTRDTPLRFLEIHAGYFARGFTDEEISRNEPLRREPYIGVGINLGELLFGSPKMQGTKAGRFGRRVLEYVQIPYTYAATSRD